MSGCQTLLDRSDKFGQESRAHSFLAIPDRIRRLTRRSVKAADDACAMTWRTSGIVESDGRAAIANPDEGLDDIVKVIVRNVPTR